MQIKVNVTAEDIAKGKRGVMGQCPIALAVRRTIGGKRRVVQVSSGIDVGTCSQNVEVATCPKSVGQFVGNFDCKGRGAVTPFTFNMGISDKLAAKLIGTPVPADWSAAVVTKGAKVEVRK